jgi:hypothetical protein
MVSSITRHHVWNIKLFFVYSGVIMRIGNMFALPCALLCCSSNHYVLLKARYNECAAEKPIPVTGRFKTWVRLLGLWFRIPETAWMSVFCDCCMLSNRGLSVWSLVLRSPTACAVYDWFLEASWKERPWPEYGSKRQIYIYNWRAINKIICQVQNSI